MTIQLKPRITEQEADPNGPQTQRHSSEGCAVVDMVRVAIELARCGQEYGWDVAERFTRNYLTQAQVQQVKPFITADDLAVNHAGRRMVNKVPANHRESEDVWHRVVGAMAGWGAPNDILDAHGRLAMCIQNCCGSHLPMGLMHVWEHIVTRHDDTLHVNMLMSQDGPLARTVDHQPQEGVLEIYPKVSAKLAIRMPEWVDDEHVQVLVDGQPVAITWPSMNLHSRFLQIAEVAAGSTIRVEYPLRECTITERLGGVKYTTEWRGDTVVNITPKGTYIPIFTDDVSAQTGEGNAVKSQEGSAR